MLTAPAPPPSPNAASAPSGEPSDAAAARRRKSDRGAAAWATLGVFWLLALASVGVDALNFRQMIAAGQRQEREARQITRARAGVTSPDLLEPLAQRAEPLMLDPDGHAWVLIAQEEARAGRLRQRTVSFDYAPQGRELHWSSSFQWWLRLLGAAARPFNGLNAEQSIAAVAAWSNPFLFALFLTALLLVAHRRAGVWTAGTLVLTLATLQPVEWDFGYARPDHHGLHQMAFLGMLLSLLAAGLGWVRGEADGGNSLHDNLLTEAQARRWFALSGVCAGLGLWIGATQQMLLIGATGAGAGLGILCFARPAADSAHPAVADGGARFAPELWRRWGQAGAATSFVLYLAEYFPSHLTMRLEVNHPLYSLAMLGGGEVLCALGRWRTQNATASADANADARRQVARGLALGALALGALPLAVLAGPRAWYSVNDPFMLRVLRCVAECQPLVTPWSAKVCAATLRQHFGALPLALPLAALALLLPWTRRRLAPHRRATLLAAGVAAAVCVGWTLAQSRWVGLAGAALAVLATVALPAAWGRGGKPSLLALLALTAPGWAWFWASQTALYNEPPGQRAHQIVLEPLASQEFAWSVRQAADAAGIAAPRVLGPMEAAPALRVYAGADSVSSIYWENLSGCRIMADFYADAGDADARRIARERGLDFVAVLANPVFVRQMYFLKTGGSRLEDLRRTLVFRLANPINAQPPAWLEPTPLRAAPLAEAKYRLYRVRRDRL